MKPVINSLLAFCYQRGLVASALEQQPVHCSLLGRSRAMQEVFKQIGIVAPTDTTVLIRGERGTGGKLVAQLIHSHSNRSAHPFVPAMAPWDSLSHRMGEVRGEGLPTEALAKANNGTLLINYIGSLSNSAQAQLLDIVPDDAQDAGTSTGRLNIRVIATTEPDCENAIRKDLYYRLGQFVIQLPPLRRHPEDIPELVRDFVNRYAGRPDAAQRLMPTEEAMLYLQQQSWHGNLRQLRRLLRTAVLEARGNPITRQILERLLEPGGGGGAEPFPSDGRGQG